MQRNMIAVLQHPFVRICSGLLLSAIFVACGGAVPDEPGDVPQAVAADISVTVDAGRVLRTLPKDFQGVNTASWDGTLGNANLRTQVQRAGTTSLRYPGGNTADNFLWDDPAMYPGGQDDWQSDPNEFNSFVRAVGASAIITTNVRKNDPGYAAAWVARSKQLGYNWLQWEVGNEYDLLPLSDADYADRFARYARAMKAADSRIQVGGPVATNAYYWVYGALDRFLAATGDRKGSGTVDFVSLHWYPGSPEQPNLTDLLAAPQAWDTYEPMIRGMIAAHDTRSLPIRITEWNTFPYGPGAMSMSIASALFVADTLGEFAQHGIASSNYWAIHSGPTTGADGTTGSNSYLQDGGELPLPTYYGHWMFSRLGKRFIVPSQSVARSNVASFWAGLRDDGVLTVLAVNKTGAPKTANVNLRGFVPQGTARRFDLVGNGAMDQAPTLNGQRMPADVTAVPARSQAVASNFDITLPAWSVTVLELAPGSPTRFDTSKFYKIALRKSPGYVLDCSATPTNGTNVHLWQYRGNDRQQWKFTDVGGGYYEIAVRNNPRFCLDESQPTVANGSNIQMWQCVGNDRQQWKLVDVGGGYYELRLRNNEAFCVDESQPNPVNGANIQAWTCVGNDRQQWQITAVP
jgi:hypothetical protein